MNDDTLPAEYIEAEALPVEAPTSTNPLALIERALKANVSPDALEKLMDLEDRYRAGQARRAFIQAINGFQAASTAINRNKTADAGQYKFTYATLEHIQQRISAALRDHGLMYRWNSTLADGVVTVTCIVSHVDGHSEATTWSGPADSRAPISGVQKAASATTYAKRQSLIQALGLIVGDEDDDGQDGATAPLSAAQAEELVMLARQHKMTLGEVRQLSAAFGVSTIAEIPAASYADAKLALVRRVQEGAP